MHSEYEQSPKAVSRSVFKLPNLSSSLVMKSVPKMPSRNPPSDKRNSIQVELLGTKPSMKNEYSFKDLKDAQTKHSLNTNQCSLSQLLQVDSSLVLSSIARLKKHLDQKANIVRNITI